MSSSLSLAMSNAYQCTKYYVGSVQEKVRVSQDMANAADHDDKQLPVTFYPESQHGCKYATHVSCLMLYVKSCYMSSNIIIICYHNQ